MNRRASAVFPSCPGDFLFFKEGTALLSTISVNAGTSETCIGSRLRLFTGYMRKSVHNAFHSICIHRRSRGLSAPSLQATIM